MRILALALAAALPTVGLSDLCDFVDPFVGTAGTGHTFPGACVPFGLIQASPDTGNGDWDHCSGYVFGDQNLYGFSQTHLNGTGCADLGDIRLLPFTSDDVPEHLPMDKATERASPGYYTVTAGGVKTEVTATERVASYRFTFPKGAKKRLLVDTQWGLYSWGDATNRVLAADVVVTNDAIVGTLDVRQWNSRHVAFVVKPDSSHAVKSVAELKRRPGEKAPRFVIDFNEGDEPVFVDVALSANSVKAADNNLLSEHMDISQAPNPIFFDCLVKLARGRWNAILEKAKIEGTDEQKKNWYTSLYHLCVQPNDISDRDCVFSATRTQRPVYSTFSTWDTFRAAGPLYTILMPERAAEFVESMLKQGEKTGYLPIWTLWGDENQCMIGVHSIPMIVDAWLKGVWKGEPKRAYRQIRETLMAHHGMRRKEDWVLLDKYGYYPFDIVKGESVSRTLECAYDDWCAYRMALMYGDEGDVEFFLKRSESWKNVFDVENGYARGKNSKGEWRTPYDPFRFGRGHGDEFGNDFTEGNAFQYSWHVMQDVDGLVAAMGGREKFLERLDSVFTLPSKNEGENSVLDVTGLIGQYVQGNEPSHHVIYFYSLLGEQNKAADRIRDVFDRFYLPKPDGLCGNDDCGQMSAWYLFSAMGFYPFNPCGGDFAVGAPQVPKVTLSLENGKTFTVVAKNLSKENRHVKAMTLDGEPFAGPILTYARIMAGGELVFEMCE